MSECGQFAPLYPVPAKWPVDVRCVLIRDHVSEHANRAKSDEFDAAWQALLNHER